MTNLLIISDLNIYKEGLRHIMQHKEDNNVYCAESIEFENHTFELSLYDYNYAIIDTDLKHLEYRKIIKVLKMNNPNIKIVVSTNQIEEEELKELIDSSLIIGCFNKTSVRAEDLKNLKQIIKESGSFFDYYSSGILLNLYTNKVSNELNPTRKEIRDIDTYTTVSEREKEVIKFLIKGKGNSEIADTLSVSINTIRSHISRLLIKLNYENRSELVYHALENNWFTLDEIREV